VGQPVEVVVTELHSASAELAGAAQRLQDGLSGVNDEITELLGSGWKGDAASAYAPVWQQWNDGARKVVEGLARMSELLDIAGREYARTDESAAQGVGSAMQGGGGSGAAAGGVAGATGGAPAASATQAAPSGSDGAGQTLGALPQLGQQAMQPLSQMGQAIGGLIRTAVELATELAETSADDEDETGDHAEDDEKDDGAAASGDSSAGVAPVEAGPHQVAVEQPSE
jgi:WXG100 family type VII secretion target